MFYSIYFYLFLHLISVGLLACKDIDKKRTDFIYNLVVISSYQKDSPRGKCFMSLCSIPHNKYWFSKSRSLFLYST